MHANILGVYLFQRMFYNLSGFSGFHSFRICKQTESVTGAQGYEVTSIGSIIICPHTIRFSTESRIHDILLFMQLVAAGCRRCGRCCGNCSGDYQSPYHPARYGGGRLPPLRENDPM